MDVDSDSDSGQRQRTATGDRGQGTGDRGKGTGDRGQEGQGGQGTGGTGGTGAGAGMFPSLVGSVNPSSAHRDKRRDSRPTPERSAVNVGTGTTLPATATFLAPFGTASAVQGLQGASVGLPRSGLNSSVTMTLTDQMHLVYANKPVEVAGQIDALSPQQKFAWLASDTSGKVYDKLCGPCSKTFRGGVTGVLDAHTASAAVPVVLEGLLLSSNNLHAHEDVRFGAPKGTAASNKSSHGIGIFTPFSILKPKDTSSTLPTGVTTKLELRTADCAFTDCAALLYIAQLPLMEVAINSLKPGSIAGLHQLGKARAGVGGTSQKQQSPLVLRRCMLARFSPLVLLCGTTTLWGGFSDQNITKLAASERAVSTIGISAEAMRHAFPSSAVAYKVGQVLDILREWKGKGVLGNAELRADDLSEGGSDTFSIMLTTRANMLYYKWAVEESRRNPQSALQFCVDATGGMTKPLRPAASGFAQVNLNVFSLTNDLTTCGFSAGLGAFRAECAQTLNEFTPRRPRITTDCDLTMIKPLLQEFVPTSHLRWKVAQEETSGVGKGPAPPFCGSPFPGCNISPAGEETMPVLFADQCVLTLCNYHKFRDVRDWFASSPHMKGLPLRRKATWRRLMLLLESVLLNSLALSGIQSLPLLLQLLKLFSKLLLLPSTLQVPSVHLAGHMSMRLPTLEQIARKRTTVLDPGPPVAVMEFACGGVSFTVEHYARHIISTIAHTTPICMSENDVYEGAEGVQATGPHAAIIMAAVVEAVDATDEVEAAVEEAVVEAAAAALATLGVRDWPLLCGSFLCAVAVKGQAPLLVIRNRAHCTSVNKSGKRSGPLHAIFMERMPKVIWIAPTLLSSLFPAIYFGGRTSASVELWHRNLKENDQVDLPKAIPRFVADACAVLVAENNYFLATNTATLQRPVSLQAAASELGKQQAKRAKLKQSIEERVKEFDELRAQLIEHADGPEVL
ncbi:hypothetical protein B484DRAFT_394699 [Ochromonadaceae sp. CCMP2298]|nr:hypothetical protein B484DRAFT_394699 [Ochromonadaceae sp. CCMP2298]